MLQIISKIGSSFTFTCVLKHRYGLLSSSKYMLFPARYHATNVEEIHKPRETKENEEEFTTIYKHDKIAFAAIINKLNKYVFYGSAGISSVAIACYLMGSISGEKTIGYISVALTFLLPMQVFAFNTKRMVGFIYLNKARDQVKVAYVDYFGNREEILLPIENVMAFSDIPASPLDHLYRKVKTFESTTYCKLDLRLGKIVNEELFTFVFGNEKLM